jgi:Copper amine oxidase N-terminal domain.
MKKLFTLMLSLVLILTMITPINAMSVNAASKSKEFVIENSTTNEVYLITSTTNKKTNYVPLKETYKRLNASVSVKGKTYTVRYDKDKIVFTVGKSNVVQNGKKVKISDTIKKINKKICVPVDFVAKSLSFKLYTKEAYEKKCSKDSSTVAVSNPSEVTYDSNELPKSALSYNMKILHETAMPYWEWNNYDAKYLDNVRTNLTSNNKQVLIQEIFLLSQYQKLWGKQYTQVGDFKFYPSTSVGVLDAVGRAIESRRRLLTEADTYCYAEVGQSGLFRDDEIVSELNINKDNFESFIQNDIKMIKALKLVPFNTDEFSGYRVLNAPFNMKTVTRDCDAAGYTSCDSTQIVLAACQIQIEDTFYHELGHAWAYLNLNKDYTEYAKLRGHDTVVTNEGNENPVEWCELTSENFAEDFRIAMSPYADKSTFSTCYAEPTEQDTKNIVDFIHKNQKDTGYNETVKINGEQRLGDVYTTNSDSVSFSGMMNGPFQVTITKPDFSKETIKITPNDFNYSQSINLKEEGTYIVSGLYGGTYYIMYYKNIETAPLDLSFVKTETNSWEQLKAQDVSDSTALWFDHAKFLGGYWVKDRSDSILVSISEGKEIGVEKILKNIKLSDVQLEADKTVITVTSGDEEGILLKLPLSAKDKPIVVNGLQNSHLTEDTTDKLNISIPTQDEIFATGNGIFNTVICGSVKSSTGMVYYEIKSGDTVLYKDSQTLDTASQHWSYFAPDTIFFDAPNLNGQVDYVFYEDSSKKVELGRMHVTADSTLREDYDMGF